jgi:cell division protein YceG involved in septum cleavage
MNQNNNKSDLKKFFIKLIAIIFAIVVVINVSYNLIIAERLEKIGSKKNIALIKNKIRSEIKSGLDKDKILNEEDKVLLYKFYLKLKNEFDEIESR